LGVKRVTSFRVDLHVMRHAELGRLRSNLAGAF
jgi:hypothetical protein